MTSHWHSEMLRHFAEPAALTCAGRFANAFATLPRGVERLVQVIQGLVIYDAVATDFYGCRLPAKRESEIHLRTVEAMLERIFALDARPLDVPRPPKARLVGRCHHFTRLLVAMLRAQGVPARARCGFGAYFNPGRFEDHWVCETWNATQQRWVLVDTQFDAVWLKNLRIHHSPFDVPRDAFVVAGEAWEAFRRHGADPSLYGLSFINLAGPWYIASNLIRDLAALNKMEMLPWDVWGGQPQPGAPVAEKLAEFLDRVAEFSRDPDGNFPELRRLHDQDSRVRVPAAVFNAVLNRAEANPGAAS